MQRIAIVLLAVAASACSSSSVRRGGAAQLPARGTATCQNWQHAYCDYRERCGEPDRGACAAEAQSIQCTSDAQARSCAARLSAASCSSPPQGCEPKDVADRAFAKSRCNDLVSAECDAVMRCSKTFATKAECTKAYTERYDCARAVGAGAGVEACIEHRPKLACGETQPSDCQASIYALR